MTPALANPAAEQFGAHGISSSLRGLRELCWQLRSNYVTVECHCQLHELQDGRASTLPRKRVHDYPLLHRRWRIVAVEETSTEAVALRRRNTTRHHRADFGHLHASVFQVKEYFSENACFRRSCEFPVHLIREVASFRRKKFGASKTNEATPSQNAQSLIRRLSVSSVCFSHFSSVRFELFSQTQISHLGLRTLPEDMIRHRMTSGIQQLTEATLRRR